jgi:hypothetical protein
VTYLLAPVRGAVIWRGRSAFLPHEGVEMRASSGGTKAIPSAGIGLLDDLLRAMRVPAGYTARGLADLEAALTLILRAEPQIIREIKVRLDEPGIDEPVREVLARLAAGSDVPARTARRGSEFRPAQQLSNPRFYRKS